MSLQSSAPNLEREREELAAIMIQKNFRGFIIRKLLKQYI